MMMMMMQRGDGLRLKRAATRDGKGGISLKQAPETFPSSSFEAIQPFLLLSGADHCDKDLIMASNDG
jgi:hypothetical protein